MNFLQNAFLQDSGREPKISVVIPTYNRAHCIEVCVQSVLTQSYENLEVIVVDDGSSDNSRDILARLAESDPRINVLHQDNSGVSSARNTGIRASQGEYIAFLDSDDRWYPEKLEKQLEAISEHTEPVLSMTALHITYPDGTSEQSTRRSDGMPLDRVLAGGPMVGPSSWLVSKELFNLKEIGFFDESLHFGEDAQWVLEYLKSGREICFLNEPLTYFSGSDEDKVYRGQAGAVDKIIEMNEPWLRATVPDDITNGYVRRLEGEKAKAQRQNPGGMK